MIIRILAVIGAMCTLSVIAMMILVITAAVEDKYKEKKHKRWYCALTGEECIYTADRETCADCPICEDAKEKEKEC